MKPIRRRAREIRILQRAVEELLFREWDPIGVNQHSDCVDEYNSYAAIITRLLCEGADEHKLVDYLRRFQRDNMRLSDVEIERDRRVAQLLLQLLRK